MTPEQEKMLRETYRLSQENNRQLRRMRSSAFWGRVVTLIFYAALLLAPIWFYMTYLSGAVQNLLQYAGQAQTTAQQAQNQFSTLENDWKSFEARFGFATTSTSSQQ